MTGGEAAYAVLGDTILALIAERDQARSEAAAWRERFAAAATPKDEDTPEGPS